MGSPLPGSSRPPPCPAGLYPRKGLALSVAGMVIISPDALLVRMLTIAGAWELALYRSLFMGVAIAVFLAIRHGSDVQARFRAIGGDGLLMTGVFAATSIGFAGALTQTTAANALFIIATVPVFGALFGWLILRERVPLRVGIAIAVALAGVALIFGSSLGEGGMLGNVIALGTAMCLGLNLVLRRRIDRDITLPALCLAGFLAALVSTPFADPTAVSTHDIGVMALIGFIILPIALGLFYTGARYAPAAEVGLIALIETVLGPLWVWLVLTEEPALETMVGGALVLAAIAGNSALAIFGQKRAGTR